jgi:hypothetical protein
MVENALGAGRAATSTAPMKGIGGALNNLEKTLNKSLNGTESAPAAPATHTASTIETVHVTPAVVTSPVLHYDEPKQIETGMLYPDLLKRFGPATLSITTGMTTRILSYMSREGTFQVDLVDDKVTAITLIN